MNDKITELDMNVITDCLYGSLSIADRGNLWKFNEKARQRVLNKLFNLMDSVESGAKYKESE